MWAVLDGNPEVLKLLLAKGGDPKAKDRTGKTALDLAREAKSADAVQVFVQLK